MRAVPKTFSVVKHYRRDSPLLPSGLLAPVQLLPLEHRALRAGE